MFQNFPPAWLHIPNREDNLFSLVFAIVLSVPITFVLFFPEGFETVKYPLFIFLVGLGGLILAFRKQLYFEKKILVLLGLFWLLNLLSAIFALDQINSFIGLYGRYTGSVFFVTGWVLFILLLLNAVKHEEPRRMTLLRVLVFNALIVAVYGLAQYFDFGYYAGLERPVRPIIPSTIGNQNFYAMFLATAVPAVILLWHYAQSKWASLYYFVTVVLIVWSLVMSGSRGGVLGLAVTSVIFMFLAIFRKYPKFLWRGMLGVLILAGVFYVAFFAGTRSDSSAGVSANAQYTTQTRYIIWSDSVKIVDEFPLLGTGSGNFFIAFEGLGNIALSGNERFDDAHNFALNIAVTNGIPALLTFLIILGITALFSWRETKFQRASALWVISALTGLVVAMSFNPVSISIWMVLALLVAFAFSYSTIKRDLNLSYKFVLLGPSVIIMIFALLFISSETLAVYGKRAYKEASFAKSERLLSVASKLNPYNTSAIVHLVGSKIRLGHPEETIENGISKILAQHPKSSGIYKTSADLNYMLYRNTQNPEHKNRVFEIYDQAIMLEPNFAVLYGSAAYAAYKLEEPELAMSYLNKQLSLPDNDLYPYSWILRGKLMQEAGKKEETIHAIEKAYSQMKDQTVIKVFLEEARATDDITKLKFPVYLPDVEI